MALLLRGKLNAFLGQLHCYCKVCNKVQKQKGIERVAERVEKVIEKNGVSGERDWDW